jgi:hypothetical protein
MLVQIQLLGFIPCLLVGVALCDDPLLSSPFQLLGFIPCLLVGVALCDDPLLSSPCNVRSTASRTRQDLVDRYFNLLVGSAAVPATCRD